jgi:hypothetical protein
MNKPSRNTVGIAFSALILCGMAWTAQAAGEPGDSWRPNSMGMAAISTLVFGLIGIALAILGFKLFDAVIPFSLEKEICERQNIAVAILCGSMMLGICIIVATAVL